MSSKVQALWDGNHDSLVSIRFRTVTSCVWSRCRRAINTHAILLHLWRLIIYLCFMQNSSLRDVVESMAMDGDSPLYISVPVDTVTHTHTQTCWLDPFTKSCASRVNKMRVRNLSCVRLLEIYISVTGACVCMWVEGKGLAYLLIIPLICVLFFVLPMGLF